MASDDDDDDETPFSRFALKHTMEVVAQQRYDSICDREYKPADVNI
jgi:hypothetical protein